MPRSFQSSSVLSFMCQGLASLMRCTYSCAQENFVSFYIMIGHLSLCCSPCPASEWTLCLSATYLGNSLWHSSIKVYLSAVWSLHVDQGFIDPLENCLWLQQVLRGIKGSQGTLPSRPCLPFSSNILRIIYSTLDLNSFGNVMFWAACLLAYFGFCGLPSSVPSLSAFNPSVHLSVCDVSVDGPLDPSCLQVFRKWSSTNSLTGHRQVKSHSPFCWSPWWFFQPQFSKWDSHFCSKGRCSRSPCPGLRPVEKWCLQTIY